MAEFTALRNNVLGDKPIYGLPFVAEFPLLDADGDPVSPSSPDSEISKNGDTAADCTNEATEISGITGGCYLSLTGTEMTCDAAYIECSSTGAKATHIVLHPVKLATVRTGTAADDGSGTSSIVLDSGASSIDDFYNGMIVAAVIDGTTEVRTITDYNGTTKAASVTPDFTTAPDVDDTFTVYLPPGVDSRVKAVLPDAPPGNGGIVIAGTGDHQLSTASGRVDVGKVGGTSQTAGDLAALINTVDDYIDTELATLTTEVGKIPKSDGTSSWNATALAAIQSEANDALVANNLDHLMAVAAVAGDVVNSSIIARLTSKSATPAFTDFVNTTDSLQAIRDNHPASFNGMVISAGGVVQADLAAILGTECSEVGTLSHIANNFFKFFFNNEAASNVQIDEIGEIWNDTNDIQSRLPAALTADGNMKADTLRVGGTLQTAGDLAALINTIDDILDTEFPALTTTVGALFTTARTESYRAAGAAPTIDQFIFETLAHLGDCSISSTTKTLNKLNGTSAKTFTLNSSSTPTSITEAT